MVRDTDWLWHPESPSAGTKKTMEVVVPETRHVQQPFGFARALLDVDNGWQDHADALAQPGQRRADR